MVWYGMIWYGTESRILAPGRPRLQAAGWQCLKLQIAVAFPNPQTRVFPGTEFFPEKARSPKVFPCRLAAPTIEGALTQIDYNSYHGYYSYNNYNLTMIAIMK